MESLKSSHMSQAVLSKPLQDNDLNERGCRTSLTNNVYSATKVSLGNINNKNRIHNKPLNIVKKIFEPNYCDIYLKDKKEYIDQGKEILQSVDTINQKSLVEAMTIENEDNIGSNEKPIKVDSNSDADSIVEMNAEYDVEFINNDMETDDEFLNNEMFDNERDSDVLYICEDDTNIRTRNCNSVLDNDNDAFLDNDRNCYNNSDNEICEVLNRTRCDNSSLKSRQSNGRNQVKNNDFPVKKSRKMIPKQVDVVKSKEKIPLTDCNKFNISKFNSEVLADELLDDESDNWEAEFLNDDDSYNTISDISCNVDSVYTKANNNEVNKQTPEILGKKNMKVGPKKGLIKSKMSKRKPVNTKVRNSEENKQNPKILAKKNMKIVPKTQVVKSKISKRKPAYLDGLKLFKITELSYDEQLVEFEDRKESPRYKSSHYKCVTCYKGCNTKKAYERHILKHTRDFGNFECSICKLRYRRRNFLNAHVREVHSNKYNCNSCTFVTKHKRLALLHEKWHKGITYECPHCKIKFTKVSSYFSHLRMKHPSDIVCTICGSSFIGEKGLHQHMIQMHRLESKDPVPTCQPCGITFSSKAAYKQHVKLTFKHRKNEFPTEKFVSWYKTGRMANKVRDGMVRSQHFTSDDFHVTKSCTKKPRHSAEPPIIQACLICLDTDSKLYNLRKYNLEEGYRNLTGCEFSNGVNLSMICITCAQRLINFIKFREKSIRGHTLLMELFEKNKLITVKNIKTINREKNNLTSTISKKIFEPDHCDQNFTFTGNNENNYIEINKCNIINENIKDESKDVSKDEMDIKFENLVDENNPDIGNTKFINEIEFIDEVSEAELNEDSDEVEIKVKVTDKGNVKKIKPVKAIKLFKVRSLNYEEQLADVVKRKESPNYQNSFYKCTICFKGFNDKNAYNAHLLRHTNKFGDFECALCGLHFKLRYHLSHHIRQNHSWRYSCMTCPFVTKHKRSAYLHERWHKGTKYKCSHCDEQFIRVSTYMTHLRIKHPSEFSCTICGYSFVGRKGLDQHMNMKHRFEDVQNASGPICESCNIRFATDDAYNQHMKVSPKHSSDGIRKRNDPSVYCKRQYKGIRQQTAESDPVTCEQCGIELRDYRLYTHHFKRAHPDKNRTKYAPTSGHCLCEQCGKVFQSQALLRYHMPVHSGQTMFTCDVCDKGFMLRANLLIHKKIHSDTRESFECPVCGKSFAYQSNRARHMVLHNGLKPFKCEICEKNFSTAAERTSHVAHVHLKKPWPKRNRGTRVTRHVRRQRDTTTVQDE